MIHRLPSPGSRWVWMIEDPRQRLILGVTRVLFTGHEWLVTTLTLPDAPQPTFRAPGFRSLSEPKELHHRLEEFWEVVTPVGGRVEDLSYAIDPDQYSRKRPA